MLVLHMLAGGQCMANVSRWHAGLGLPLRGAAPQGQPS